MILERHEKKPESREEKKITARGQNQLPRIKTQERNHSNNYRAGKMQNKRRSTMLRTANNPVEGKKQLKPIDVGKTTEMGRSKYTL